MPTLTPPSADSLASRLRQVRRATRAQRDEAEGTARELVLVAFGVPVLALSTLAVVMLAVLLMAGSGLTGFASAVAAAWLAVHHVPVTLSGVTIGVLPLLPTVLVAAGTAVFVASAAGPARTPRELGALGAAAVGGPTLVTAASLAVVMDGSSVLPVQSPNALLAFVYTIAIHAVAAFVGIAWRRRRDLRTVPVTAADRRALRYGALTVAALLAAGAVLVVARLLWRFPQVGALMGQGYDLDGYLGLTALSILYLPNLIIGASAVLLGSDAHVGTVSVDLFSVRAGDVPPLPVLGVLPDGPGLGMWGLIGLLIPAGIAGYIGWRCRSLDPMVHVRSVGIAAASSATVMVLLTWLAGGRLGELGGAGITVTTAGVFTLGWVAVIGLCVALIYGVLPSTRAARDGVHADFDAWIDDTVLDDDDTVLDADADADRAERSLVDDGFDYADEYYADDGYEDDGYDEYDSDAEYDDQSDEYDPYTAGHDTAEIHGEDDEYRDATPYGDLAESDHVAEGDFYDADDSTAGAERPHAARTDAAWDTEWTDTEWTDTEGTDTDEYTGEDWADHRARTGSAAPSGRTARPDA